MSNHEFRKYPQVAYLLVKDCLRHEIFRVYTNRAFALKARGARDVVFELPLPDLGSLKVVGE